MTPSDLGLLVTLDALLQTGSVTAAARRVGLSTPAMSHALARIREQLGDAILVRAGRGMTLTPRAEALKPRVHAVVNEARATLAPEPPLAPSEVVRTFVIRATDHVLAVLGVALDRILVAEAPSVSLRFTLNTPDDAAALRDGAADLAIGIYGELPQEMRSRPLMTDRFVCVVRQGHPEIGKRLTLDHFVRTPHIQVAPRGKPGGYVDDVLRERGLERRVARAVPFFLTALHLVARTDYLLTISERVARAMAPSLGLVVFDPPIELRPYALSLVWHPRLDGDSAHQFLRDAFTRAAKESAGDAHAAPRRRLGTSDPTSGQTRRRPRRQA
jgi:DNA-binding transcriptional LysR family regulator